MDGPWLLGIEIGGTKLQVGLGRRPGVIDVLERRVVEPGRGAEGIRALIRDACTSALAAQSLSNADVRGVGVGFGGPVDAKNGRTQASFQIDGWTDYPLADWIKGLLGVDAVSIHNDADAAGLAEARLGAGVGRSPILYLTIGSGVGGALIIDGRIYRGAGLGAAEIGHLNVPPPEGGFGPRFPRAGTGRLRLGDRPGSRARAVEVVAQGDGWEVLDAAGGDVERITTVMVAQAADRGDPRSLALLDQACRALGVRASPGGRPGRPSADHPRRRRLADRRPPLVRAPPPAGRRRGLPPVPNRLRHRPCRPRRGSRRPRRPGTRPRRGWVEYRGRQSAP